MSAARRTPLAVALSAVTLGAGTADAATTFVPYASASGAYDSNIVRSPGGTGLTAGGDTVRDDYVLSGVLGAEAAFLQGDQKLRARIEGRHTDYQRANGLDHDEYLIGTGLDFTLYRALTGTLDASQERRMAPFEDLQGNRSLSLQRDRTVKGRLDLDLSTEWRFGQTGSYHQLITPATTLVPEYRVRELGYTGAIDYRGVSRLTAGISGGLVRSLYAGGPGTVDAEQTAYSIAGTMSYTPTELTTYSLSLGMTRREDNVGGSNNFFSGEAHYRRPLTGKTDIDVSYSRQTRNFATGANSVIEDSGRIQLNWDATAKIRAGLETTMSFGRFQVVAAGFGANDGRKDRLRSSSMFVNYDLLRWLSLSASAGYTTRLSTLSVASYNGAVVNLGAQMRFE